MTRQEKETYNCINTVDCLKGVTTWTGLPVIVILLYNTIIVMITECGLLE